MHSDGYLYAILECGHAVRGVYDSQTGMPVSESRLCMSCAARFSKEKLPTGLHGYLDDSEAAIRNGQNIILWEKLPSQLDDINKKHLDEV